MEITFKKTGSNAEGSVWTVFADGQRIGEVTKWKGLFESRTDEGSNQIHERLKDAVDAIAEWWAFNNDIPWIGEEDADRFEVRAW